MGRKFSFFNWATGNSSESKKDFRRLLTLLGCVIGVVVLFFVVRSFFWIDGVNREHPHEKGPHGGIVVAIDEANRHFHAEVLLEDDGRIHVFVYGKDTEHVMEVSPQLLIGQVRRQGEDSSTSLILRPAGRPGETEKKTSHFIGRLSLEMMEHRLSISFSKVEIQERSFAFQFELHERRDGKKRALDLEKAVVLAPRGKYTVSDVEATEQKAPSEKFQGVKVAHDWRSKKGDVLCPMTRAKADPRISWQVNGKIYRFCCAPCIVDFIGWAQENPVVMVAPEDLVQQN